MCTKIDREVRPWLSEDARVRVYASFERERGGLLHVLQVAVTALMYLLVRAPGPGPASLSVSWGLYLLYFAVRWPLWQRLYRRQGHLEERAALAAAGRGVKFMLLFVPALTLLLILLGSVSVPLLPALFTVTGWVLVLVRFGRLRAAGLVGAPGRGLAGHPCCNRACEALPRRHLRPLSRNRCW